MKRTQLKAKIQGRNKQQKDYARRFPKCRVCGRPEEHIHHINHDRKNNTDNNLESLCFLHHTGGLGIHSMEETKWIERFHLTTDIKWKERYLKLIGKILFKEEIENIFNRGGLNES